MEQKSDRLYPSAPPENKNDDLERRIEKRLSDVISLNNHMSKIKEMITYFKDRNNKSKKRFKNYKMLTRILKSFDAIVIIATSPSSITSRFTGIGLIVIPISTGIAC